MNNITDQVYQQHIEEVKAVAKKLTINQEAAIEKSIENNTKGSDIGDFLIAFYKKEIIPFVEDDPVLVEMMLNVSIMLRSISYGLDKQNNIKGSRLTRRLVAKQGL